MFVWQCHLTAIQWNPLTYDKETETNKIGLITLDKYAAETINFTYEMGRENVLQEQFWLIIHVTLGSCQLHRSPQGHQILS